MSHISEIYGCIIGPDYYEQTTLMWRRNADRINALADADDWPPLTRDMFAVPEDEHNFNIQMIAFCASQNGVHLWARWLEKFETLLKTLYWDEVNLHLRTEAWGTFHYVWTPLGHSLTGKSPSPVTEWEFMGGPRQFT